MSGRVIVIIMLATAGIFAAGLWYYQVHAFYERVAGVTSLQVDGQAVPVSAYDGIDAFTSPLKIRACFRAEPGAFAALDDAAGAAPLRPPYWFDCFDAAAITEALANGAATAHIIADETPRDATGYSILTYVAVYPDGRGYLWRQFAE
ncbi:MAG: DUF6446 family protein [Pseudomonadota bacterium]